MNTNLTIVSAFFVCSGIITAVLLLLDILRYRQTMRIMNPVWVLTGLWAHFLALFAYLKFGRQKNRSVKTNLPEGKKEEVRMDMGRNYSKWESIALSTLHCGAGCTLADILGEGFGYFVPLSLGTGWVLDYVLALLFGVCFQYAAIREMEKITPVKAFGRAFKADFLSLTSWQIGMYGWMAVVYFVLFKEIPLQKDSWIFWFMMQIAMFFGFLFAYPMNALLIRWGIKKGM